MALSLNKPKLDNLAGGIWKSAERLRGKFKAYEYQNVILPIIVIRRLECVLIAGREAKRADGHVDLSDVTMIEVPESVARGVELQAGDVLMTEGGDLDKLGRGTIWNGEIAGCLHQNHIFAIRCFRHKLSPAYLAYVTASQYGRDYFEATGKRTTNLASTNSTKVGLFPIPLPKVTEQDAICSFLDDKLGETKRIKSGIEAQIDTLIAYRKSLIHECVTGQRRISEADLKKVQAHA